MFWRKKVVAPRRRLNCNFEIDAELSAKRARGIQKHVFKCVRCGFVTAACVTDNPKSVRRPCRWYDPRYLGFVNNPECWCRGLGDLLAWGIDRVFGRLPYGEAIKWAISRAIDRTEAKWTGEEIAATDPTKATCKSCDRRRVTFNTRYPLRWLRRWICRPAMEVSEASGDRVAVCLSFAHGFGDAVQFTAILSHLRKYRPLWDVSIYCKAGAHSLFQGVAHKIGVSDRDDLGKVYADDFALVYGIKWLEPVEAYADSPSTKVERCLREELGIVPDPELWDYQVPDNEESRYRAFQALKEIATFDGERFNVVAIHYQGNSWRDAKNLTETAARKVVDVVLARGCVPLILDWEDPFRSGILREGVAGVQCFGKDHPLWKGLGRGDGANLAAVLRLCRLVVGIDSGPEHLAAATDTRTIVAWGKNHPVNYFSPKRSVIHLVRRDHAKYIIGDRATGDAFFRANYNFEEMRSHVRVALPDLVERELSDGIDRAGGVLRPQAICGTGSSDRSGHFPQ